MKVILSKLNKIQTELKAPKGQFNDFGKYKYRSCEDILEGLKPLLRDYECAIAISDEIVIIGERYYIKSTVTIYDCISGEKIENSAFAREEDSKKGMDSSQVTGATSSYARKYALNGLLAIDDTKDSDATNKHGNDAQDELSKKEKIDTKEPQEPTEDEIEAIRTSKVDKVNIAAMQAEMLRTGVKPIQICKPYGVESINELTKEQFVKVMQTFSKTATKEVKDLGL